MTKKELLDKKVSAVSLGCDKNKVDLEKMLGRIKDYGLEVIADVEYSDIVIVNTCAFIQPAIEEAISNIIEMEELKKLGKIEKLIVTGCFPERHFSEMKENFPLVDAFLRIRENVDICKTIESLYNVPQSRKFGEGERVFTHSGAYAYLKIADGCNNACSYCTIPRIRGRYKSEIMENLVSEAKNLVARGMKEIILVAQDTTRYGEDLYGKNMLVELCRKLCKIKDLKWLRIHYAYPEKVTKELLDFIVSEDKMCKYLDIPLQHIDNQILASMRRRLDEEKTRELVKLIKDEYPMIKLRSTFIVGYPGESGKAFKKLLQFLKETQLDYAGFFPYSREQNTASFFMDKQISEWKKKSRLKKVQKIQEQVMLEKNSLLIGREMEILVDSFDESTGEFQGHTQNHSPLVDFGVRFVDNGCVRVGEFVKVKIYDFNGNDFIGEAL